MVVADATAPMMPPAMHADAVIAAAAITLMLISDAASAATPLISPPLSYFHAAAVYR